ncbi:hypothetical protein [Chryseobacterium sp. FH1]|uniref:hypothetical protein n=1 Tax=Chryseobacterium sp. FH1 TaxID=1233951 RepID=UPI0004E3183A|nr:hypothetical protein [Chryseobacterium sp. FH1]KFC20381.1 hypothetical protein IO90_14560 [Chryseobacterium sp. FH1]
MIPRLKYDPQLDSLTEKELKLLDKASDSIRKFVNKSPKINKSDFAPRDAHATTYSVVKGTFKVYEEFDRKAIFPTEKLDCIIRISHAHMKLMSQEKTIPAYGFSVKIYNDEKTIANFPMVNFPLFPIVNVSRFLKLFISINDYFAGNFFRKIFSSLRIFKSFITIIPNTLNFSFQNQVLKFLKRWNHFILSLDYHSIGVYRMGDDLVKLKLTPININHKIQDSRIDLSIENYLKSNIYELELCVQYCYNLKDQPVNQLNKMWKKSKFVPLGNIQITELLDKYKVENELLSFNPFENILGLQPVGKIQKLRDQAYKTSLQTRTEINLK